MATADEFSDEDTSPIEEVRLTVTNTDDPTLPVWTFRMWFLGLISCSLLSFLNQFFSYRTEPLVITQITVQVATLPIGHFLAKVLPKTRFGIPGCGSTRFSLNPGPFNMKEHVLISIFANAGSAFGSGSAYAVGIITIIKAFYGRNISFIAGWLLIITTQVLGYGWAGLLRKYVVEPAHMWWPSTLVQVSLFRESIARGSYSRRFLSQAHLLLLITTSCTDGGFSVNSGDDEDPSAHGSSSVTYYIFSAKPSDQNQGGSGGEKNLHDINGMSSTGGVAM